MKKNDQNQLFSAVSLVGSIGLSMIATLAVGILGGRAVDQWLAIAPWGTVVGIVLGFISGVWAIYKRITAVEREN